LARRRAACTLGPLDAAYMAARILRTGRDEAPPPAWRCWW
jgi:hypothetical protein